MAERSTSDLSADADAYLAKFDPAQAGENEPDKGGQAYLDRFGPSVVGQRPNPYDAQSQADQLLDSIDPRVNGSGGPRAPQLSAQDQADQLLDSIDPRVSGWGPPKGAPQEPEAEGGLGGTRNCGAYGRCRALCADGKPRFCREGIACGRNPP
jgi:hypothetical protein